MGVKGFLRCSGRKAYIWHHRFMFLLIRLNCKLRHLLVYSSLACRLHVEA